MGYGPSTAIHQNLTSSNYRQRQYLWVPPSVAANAVVQLSAVPLWFEKAYVYGLKAASNTGVSISQNAATVYVGEKDAVGNIYCIDPVTNNVAAPVSYSTPVGVKHNFFDFWVFIPTVGDGLLIKFC